jgi:hypothetical protein
MKPFIIATKPGAFYVDVLPILQYAPSWFPGAIYKRSLPIWRKWIRNLLDEPVRVVKEELVHIIIYLWYRLLIVLLSPRVFTRPQSLMKSSQKQIYRRSRKSI